MRRMLMMILGVVLVVGVPRTCDAQTEAGVLYLATEPNGYGGCGIRDVAGPVYVYVLARPYIGITATRFSVPLPSCASGAYRLADMPAFPVTLGNSETGVSIGFGTCKTSSDFLVLTILYFMPGTTQGCCLFPILPDPKADTAYTGQVEFVDCAFELALGRGSWSFISKEGILPPLVGDPSPSDHATERPLNATLHWTVHRCDCYLTWHVNQVYFGTTPNPPMVASSVEEDSYDPGPLQPSSTYYWKIKTIVGSSLSTTTPVWSFSTVVGVPAESTTWGRVKALYTE
jgi:hypothetical protein